jgi:uncharacterized protein
LKHVVLDTNVVVSAMLWGGSPRKLFDLADTGNITLFTSVDLLRELTGILSRNKFTKKIVASGQSIDQIVDGYAARAEMIITGDGPFLSVGRWQDVDVITVRDALARIVA